MEESELDGIDGDEKQKERDRGVVPSNISFYDVWDDDVVDFLLDEENEANYSIDHYNKENSWTTYEGFNRTAVPSGQHTDDG